jgi:molybdate transport system substrate-binding protein
MTMIRRLVLMLGLLFAVVTPALAQVKAPLIFAAASLQESLTDAANAWAAKGHAKPILSFAASSALARQIGAGAPADLFVSADEPWMDDVEKKGLTRAGTRVSFLANRLVLIAPRTSTVKLTVGRNMKLAAALAGGKLAMADTEAVPAGKYGKASLVALGVWPSVEASVARAENVRAALLLVDRGAAPFGIVYETDARSSPNVRIVGYFPESSHPPITYPVATLAASTSPEAEPFRKYLLSREGRAIFARYGFRPK